MDPRRRRFEALVRPLLGDLYRFARRLTGDPARAEDLLQLGLEKGLARMDQLRDDGAFKTWQSRVLYRTWLDDRDRRTEMPLPPDALEQEAPDRGPHQLAEVRQLGDRIARALDDLPTEQRAAVWLVDGQGHSFGEAAEILGVAPGTAASRVARGRRALRLALADLAAEQGVLR